MSTLKSKMSSDLAVFFDTDEFADTGYYNGSTAGIPVVMEYADPQTARRAMSAVAHVRKSDITAPAYAAALVVAGVSWTIDQPASGKGFDQDGLTWHLPVTRDQRVGPWR